jgi:uncharacterized membrane protein
MDSTLNSASAHRKFELLLSRVLQLGLKVSLFVASIGGYLFLKQHGQEAPAYTTLIDQIGQINPIKISTISEGLRQGDGIAFIELGIFILFATPIMRVGVSICAFAIRKDATYTFLAATVLAILFASMFPGFL